jgi:hypothetical protein
MVPIKKKYASLDWFQIGLLWNAVRHVEGSEGSEGSEGGTGEGGTGEGGNQERARSHADEGQIRRATSRGRCTGSGVNQKGGRSRGDSWISSV